MIFGLFTTIDQNWFSYRKYPDWVKLCTTNHKYGSLREGAQVAPTAFRSGGNAPRRRGTIVAIRHDADDGAIATVKWHDPAGVEESVPLTVLRATHN